MERSFNVYKHLKTGSYYVALSEHACDCTNARDHNSVVVYRQLDIARGVIDGPVFVRDHSEFVQKFKRAGSIGLSGELFAEHYRTTHLPSMREQ